MQFSLCLQPLSWSYFLLLFAGFTSTGVALDVASGDEFVQGIRLFGQEGGQKTLTLAATTPISMANVSWEVGEQDGGFTSGSLTIQGRSSRLGKTAILDAAMRSGLTPVLRDVSVIWQGAVLTNLCTKNVLFQPIEHLYVLTSDPLYLMSRSRSVQNFERIDLIAYMSYQELLGMIYLHVIDSTPFQRIQEGLASVSLKFAPSLKAIVRAMDDFSITFDYIETSGSKNTNLTFRSTNNPNDPLGLKLLEVGGSLMPHRLCADDGSDNGRLLEKVEYAEANYTTYPTWIVSSTPQLYSSLIESSEKSSSIVTIGDENVFHLIVMLRAVSLLDLEKPGGFLFRSELMLHGPLNSEITALDLADLTGAIKMRDATLYIRNLVLTGLSSTSSFGSNDFNTSLHLAAFERLASEVIYLFNVTLVVPKEDFIVLLSAAHRGPGWQSGAVHTAHLVKQISVFEPKFFDRASLALSEYMGWNVEGSDIVIMPSTPLLPSDQLLDQDVDRSSTDRVAVGVGVGVGVGGGLLLIGAAVAVILRQRPKWIEDGIPGDKNVDVEQAVEEHMTFGSNSQKSSQAMNQTAGGDAPVKSSAPEIIIKRGSTLVDALVESKDVGKTSRPSVLSSDQVDKSPDGSVDPCLLVREQAASLQINGQDMLTLECMLGKGAWGTVYKGTWKGLRVAVKTVLFSEHTGCVNKPPDKARAIMEAAVSTTISHPNVVSTYHYDILPVFHGDSIGQRLQVSKSANAAEDWKLFLVQEYCHGTLGSALQLDILHVGTIPKWDNMLQLLSEIAKGMFYLHGLQIIHGDLKPDNILLKADPNTAAGMVAKITDFGLAINLDPTATHASNFRSGTPFYCAPEVVHHGRMTKASDVFSFGVLMCETCSKVAPWKKHGDDYIINTEFPSFAPGTPTDFKQLALSCLELDVPARPQFQGIVASLQGFDEQAIHFLPTFKLVPETQDYHLQRVPSWTDRILHKSMPKPLHSKRPRHCSLKPQYYRSIQELCCSDHRPVVAGYEIHIDPNAYVGSSNTSSSKHFLVGGHSKCSIS